MRRFLQMFLALCGAILVVSPAGAASASTPTAGVVRVFATPTFSAHGYIVLAGAIGDYGSTLQMTSSGAVSASGNFIKMNLHKGTFKVDLTILNRKSDKAVPSVDPATCSAQLSVTAPVRVFDGTGMYAGISGSLAVTLTFAFLAPVFTSGAHKGQCNLSNNAAPLAHWGSITGTGRVRYS